MTWRAQDCPHYSGYSKISKWAQLEGLRADVAEMTVLTVSIVEHFDVIEDVRRR
jgi:hypothetical protein